MDNFNKKWFIAIVIKTMQKRDCPGCMGGCSNKLFCTDCLAEDQYPLTGIKCLDDEKNGIENRRLVCPICFQNYSIE